VRLVASDLDGTLVRPDGHITARTVAALAACEQAGIVVVFVTGRPLRWMAPVAEATGHRGVAICGNGALVADLGSGDVIETHAISPRAALRAADLLRTALPGAAFAVETLAGYRREPDFRPRFDVAAARAPAPLAELVADDPVLLKLLCRVPGGVADDLLAAARDVLRGVAEPVHSNSADHLLEISAPGVSKASTLALFAAERGIGPDDVVAFGDMPNDVPMLHWAGRSYAVADGHPEALAAAVDVAPPCAEDGVAQVLERLLAIA
jgi:Cof subfamily protein (haloacid dehalogenase superfamily)